MAAKKKKGKAKKQPTLAGLTKQVAIQREWILVLKDLANIGAWTPANYKAWLRKAKPNNSGGPPPYP